MNLLIDGDAFPNPLKPVVLRAIERLGIPTIVVANKRVFIGESKYITCRIVAAGPDEADHEIAEMAREGDLVITADIPLADRVVTKKAHAIGHRGELFNPETIKNFLATRNLMQELRDNGFETKGPAPFNKKDVHEFANRLNSYLDKIYKE